MQRFLITKLGEWNQTEQDRLSCSNINNCLVKFVKEKHVAQMNHIADSHKQMIEIKEDEHHIELPEQKLLEELLK